MRYLLDTNICVYLKKGDELIARRVSEVMPKNCFISEITVAELKYGIEKGDQRKENVNQINTILNKFETIPISRSLDVYAHELARLERIGKPIEKFDVLIAATALVNNLILITNDEAFDRIENLSLENWASHLKNIRRPVMRISKL